MGYDQKRIVCSVNRVHNGPLRQRKVANIDGVAAAKHCANGTGALHNGPRLTPGLHGELQSKRSFGKARSQREFGNETNFFLPNILLYFPLFLDFSILLFAFSKSLVNDGYSQA